MTANMGLIGPEVPDSKVLNVPLDSAEILVTNKDQVGKELEEFAPEFAAGRVASYRARRRDDPDGTENKAGTL